MAAVTMLEADEAGTVTSVDSTWVNCAQIAAGSFTASRKYLIIWNAIISGAGGANEHHVRLVHGTTPTEFPDAHAIFDPGPGGANGRGHYGGFVVWTQPGTAEAVTVQIMREASTANVTSRLTQIRAIDLTDLTENTDYWFNEVTADYTTTGTMTAQAAVTLTPNGTDDFWVLADMVQGKPTVAGITFHAEIHESVGGTTAPRISAGALDADAGDEQRPFILSRCWTAPSAASRTWSVRAGHTASGQSFNVLSSRIFVLRLNKFDQHACVYTAAADTPSQTPTWETEQTVSVTPNVTGNWFYFGALMDVQTHSATRWNNIRMQHNNSGSQVSHPTVDTEYGENQGFTSTDDLPSQLMDVESLTSGASRTINLDVRNQLTDGSVQDRCIVAFSAELAGAAAVSAAKPTVVRQAVARAGSR